MNGRLTRSNWDTFQRLAVQANMPGQEHSFATLVLNLVAECVEATGLTWDEWKKKLPGYDAAIAAHLSSESERSVQEWFMMLFRKMPANRLDVLRGLADRYHVPHPPTGTTEDAEQLSGQPSQPDQKRSRSQR